MLVTLVLLYMTNKPEWIMSVTQIDIDDDALERVMALSRAEDQEGSGQPGFAVLRRISRNARHASPCTSSGRSTGVRSRTPSWRLHRAEKENR